MKTLEKSSKTAVMDNIPDKDEVADSTSAEPSQENPIKQKEICQHGGFPAPIAKGTEWAEKYLTHTVKGVGTGCGTRLCRHCGQPFIPRQVGRNDHPGLYCSKRCAAHSPRTVRMPTDPIALKVWARQTLRNAVKAGKLVRPDSCSVCRQPAEVEAHHADYAKPLDVTWECRPCHAKHRDYRDGSAKYTPKAFLDAPEDWRAARVGTPDGGARPTTHVVASAHRPRGRA